MIKNKKNLAIIFIFANIILCITLSPILKTPYGIDDVFDSVWPYYREINNISIWKDTYNWISFFLFEMGKFNPLSNLTSALTFQYFNNHLSFKLAQLFSTIIMINLLAYCVYVITLKFNLYILVILISSFMLSFRLEYDGILHYALHQKISNSIIFLSLIFTLKSIKSNFESNLNFILSIIFLLLAFLTYETSFTLAFILLFLRIKYLNRFIFKLFLFIIIMGIMFIVKLFIFLNKQNDYLLAYQANINVFEIVESYFKLLFSAFPFSNNFIEISIFNLGFYDKISVILVFILILFSVIVMKNQISNFFDNQIEKVGIKIILEIGILIFFISPLIFSFSKGYHEYLKWGLGFHFTTLTTCGLVLITLVFFLKINLFKQSTFYIILILSLINYSNNLGVSNSNTNWYTSPYLVGYPRDIFFQSMRNGILNDFNSSDPILLLPSVPWGENSVIKKESGNLDLTLINSWWRFSNKPFSLPKECPKKVLICITKKEHYTLLISSKQKNISYVAFLKSNIFFIPKEYNPNGALSLIDFTIDAKGDNLRVLFSSFPSCDVLTNNKKNIRVNLVNEKNYGNVMYEIKGEDKFWVRKFLDNPCQQ